MLQESKQQPGTQCWCIGNEDATKSMLNRYKWKMIFSEDADVSRRAT